MTMSAETWTIQRLLQWSIGYLTNKGLIDSPRLDAELLLAQALGVSRVYLYTHFDRQLSPAEREPFRASLLRRGQGEPIAYILGTKEFLGHSFDVTPAVLIPRPDTEIAVEAAMEAAASWSLPEGEGLRILDIGTGSGCIAIALALALPEAQITAWDISVEALQVARRNAIKLGVDSRVNFVQCDALSPAPWAETHSGPYHLIISNPPYIAHSERELLSNSVLGFEPHSALFANDDGLVFYKQLANQASRLLRPDGKMILEIGSSQANRVLDILTAKGWTYPKVLRDLGRNDRCIVASHPGAVPQTQSHSSFGADAGGENAPMANSKRSTHEATGNEERGVTLESHLGQKRAGATAGGEPVYVVLEEPYRRSLEGASAERFTSAAKETGAAHQHTESASDDDRTYIPLDSFGQPKRSGATRSAPIEYVTQAISGAEEELLAKYATENASDLETEP